MSTVIRPDISEKNPYWISKHRYYELKHFCLQYPMWKEFYSKLDGYSSRSCLHRTNAEKRKVDTVVEMVEKREYYKERIDMIERAASETDPVIGDYILKAVTTGCSYEHLRLRCLLPCCKSTYYDLYRRFFWLLSQFRK